MQRYLLGVVVAFAVLAFAYGETDCESHRRNSGGSNSPMSWNIQCDENGNYESLQCVNEEVETRRWCACYNETDRITPQSRQTRHCECPLARNRAQNRSPPDECPPECTADKKYEFKEKQCCNDDCKCVDQKTGERKEDQSCLQNSQ